MAASKKTKKKTKKKRKKATKKVAKKKAPALIEVPRDEWELKWSPNKTSCKFKHETGIRGTLGCGVTDHVHMYTDGDSIFIISINYNECYACVEVFDHKGCAAVCFMDSRDCATIHKLKPDQIAKMLAAEI